MGLNPSSSASQLCDQGQVIYLIFLGLRELVCKLGVKLAPTGLDAGETP